MAAVRHRLPRVLSKIHQDLPNERLIQLDERKIRFQVQADFVAVLLRRRSVKVNEVPDKCIEVGRHELLIADSRELQKIVQQLIEPHGLLLDLLQLLEHSPVARIPAVLHVLDKQLQIEAHRRQRIADLMRESASKRGDL